MGGRHTTRFLVVSTRFLSLCPWSGRSRSGSLKNHGTDAEVDAMFDMDAETMRLPLDEKMKFEQGDGGGSFGYNLSPLPQVLGP